VPNGDVLSAYVTADFESDNGAITRSRTFHDSPAFGSPSSLSNLEPFILGDNPPRPLIPGVTITAESLAGGQARIQTADAFVHAATVDVFDSLGNPHQLVVEFQHFDQNVWRWTATLPAEPNIVPQDNTGFLEFGQDGLISSPNPLIPVSFTPPGADTVEIELNFDGTGNPLEGITQFSGTSTTRANFQDGFPLGVLQTFAFDVNGVIQASFSNGLTRPIAQVALANFNNPPGLLRVGQNTWTQSANSGTVSINRPGTGGAGTIVPGALEQSNVDLASEFTDLIIGQRGFQANTRVITTQDQILGEVVNLVR
ncbi:MAG TPA: flagellar hook-basal body complex protein, partial [bacterium]|nr:flagellar hook-basal body complex protein [bacterium]